jgi:hypothetical protein
MDWRIAIYLHFRDVSICQCHTGIEIGFNGSFIGDIQL